MTQPSRRKGGLGRGLASLIPTGPGEGSMGPRMGDAAADVVLGGRPIEVDSIGATYREIDPTAIEPNPRQPRQVFDEEALAELVAEEKRIASRGLRDSTWTSTLEWCTLARTGGCS